MKSWWNKRKEAEARQKEMERIAKERIAEAKEYQEENGKLEKKLLELQNRQPVVKEIIRVQYVGGGGGGWGFAIC